MNGPYSLLDTRVLCDGREEIGRNEIATVLKKSLNKRLRKHGRIGAFMDALDNFGQASITWNFTKRVASDDHWATLHGCEVERLSTYHLYCIGPQAHNVLERVNVALRQSDRKRRKKQRKRATLAQRRARVVSKRRLKKQQTLLAKPPRVKKTKAQRRREKYAAVPSHQHELLTPQFRKSRVFWNEALNATVAIFQIRRDGKNTAREIAARVLWRSLEHTDYRFAQFRQDGFCLQFNIADGRWRGIDLTAVSVSCTKDNRNPVYRRMRKWMRRTLHGLSPTVQQVRRDILWVGQSAA